MALPSIVLLLAFVGGVFEMLLGTIFLSFGGDNFERNQVLAGLMISGAALATAGAAWLPLRSFMLPVTVASGRPPETGTGVGESLGEERVCEIGGVRGWAR